MSQRQFTQQISIVRGAIATLAELCRVLEDAFQTPSSTSQMLTAYASAMYTATHNTMQSHNVLTRLRERIGTSAALNTAIENVRDAHHQLRVALAPPLANLSPQELSERRTRISKARTAFQRAVRALERLTP